MKKTLILTLLVIVFGFNANAQTVISNNYGGTTTGTTSQTSNSDEVEQSQSGYDIMYHGIEKGWGIGMDGVWNHLLWSVGYYSGETNDYLTKNNGMQIALGGNYRYHLSEFLYIEGRAFVGWYNWSTAAKIAGKRVEDDINKVFVGFSPRIGLDFGSWGISGGYRWDYVDFKFDKDHRMDRFTVGISFGI